MQLKEFIAYLNGIAEKNGDSIKVIMADNILVTNPIFSSEYDEPSVVITDQE